MDDQRPGLDSLLESEAAARPDALQRLSASDLICELYYAAADLRRRPGRATLARIARLLEDLAHALERPPAP